MIELATVEANLIFGAFLVVGFIAFTFSWYTRRGSAINQHPYGDIDHNSGPERPSELTHDITSDVRSWQRGVAGRRSRTPTARRRDARRADGSR